MVSTMLWILLLLALVCVPAAVGVLRGGAGRPDWPAIGGAVVVGAVFGVLAATTYEAGVSTEEAIKGIALAFLLGAVPAHALYELGRLLAGRRVWLGLACLALSAPLAFVYFIGWIVVIGFVHCPPDAYECPF
ncbi:MAG TPA: hypothetical protein VF072_12305 [Thermoleophilaceae bacterium]